MPSYLKWVLLLGGLVLGILGGLTGAWVATVMYWVFWIPGLACVAAYIVLAEREPAFTPKSDSATDHSPRQGE